MTGDDSVGIRSGQAFCCLGVSPVTRQAVYGSTVRVSRVSSEEEEREAAVLEDGEPAASWPRRIAPKARRVDAQGRVECDGCTSCRCSKSGCGRYCSLCSLQQDESGRVRLPDRSARARCQAPVDRWWLLICWRQSRPQVADLRPSRLLFVPGPKWHTTESPLLLVHLVRTWWRARTRYLQVLSPARPPTHAQRLGRSAPQLHFERDSPAPFQSL